MMIKDAGQARRMAGKKEKKKLDIRSPRIQAIYVILKDKFEAFSHNTAGAEAFNGSEADSSVLQQAYEEITGGKSLKKSTESALRPVFRRMGLEFPEIGEEEDNSKVFREGHGWHRELKRRAAELSRESGAGGTKTIGFSAEDEAYLAATKMRLDAGAITDRQLQRASKTIRRYGPKI
jgi:hypothetical protein